MSFLVLTAVEHELADGEIVYVDAGCHAGGDLEIERIRREDGSEIEICDLSPAEDRRLEATLRREIADRSEDPRW